MLITGNVRDIQPNQPRPTLELYFDAQHRSVLPSGNREAIVLHLDSVRWHATMNSNNITNPPYVHTWLTGDDGTRCTCTEVFLTLGLEENAQLEFDLTERNNFRLLRVADKGKWRPGNVPHERTARPRYPDRRMPNHTSGNTTTRSLSMKDPLAGFDWLSLYSRYDGKCGGFHSNSRHLRGIHPAPTSDRLLYYELLGQAAPDKRAQLTPDWHEALVYWKLYSQNPSGSISWLKDVPAGVLRQLLLQLPNSIPRDVSEIIRLVELVGIYRLAGMTSGIPVRTAFLHFLYPDVVPIFDKMVLKAVGAWFEGANQSMDVLRQYIPHAWTLAEQHAQSLAFAETPVRLIDMALWVERG